MLNLVCTHRLSIERSNAHLPFLRVPSVCTQISRVFVYSICERARSSSIRCVHRCVGLYLLHERLHERSESAVHVAAAAAADNDTRPSTHKHTMLYATHPASRRSGRRSLSLSQRASQTCALGSALHSHTCSVYETHRAQLEQPLRHSGRRPKRFS